MKRLLDLLGASALAISAFTVGTPATAQLAPQPLTITIDENGHGSFTGGELAGTLPASMQADLGPGGLSSVLTYSLPFAFTPVVGDVFLQDTLSPGGTPLTLDVIRFNPIPDLPEAHSTIAFYSDNIDGFDALADTSSPPGSFYTNTATLPEVGPEEGPNGATYTPTANQPGFLPGFAVTYIFISDSAPLPEPATWALMIAGFGAAGMALRRRRKTLALA
jgi:hypothetical protein